MLSPLNNSEMFSNISGYDIKKSLTLDNVENFLKSLGVNRIERYSDHLVCPTICHHPIDEIESASMKLYYYQKDKQFWCYTGDCGSMTIFVLYQKFMALNYHAVSYLEAKAYILKYINNISYEIKDKFNEEFLISKHTYDYDKNTIQVNSYDKKILDCFSRYNHPSWLREGISSNTMQTFNILFSIHENKIIIPQLDIDGRLIGVRARALNEEDVIDGKKYMPIRIGDTLYNHPTGYNLYGIYEHKKAIQRYKRAIIFEGEKSVLKHDSIYGDKSVSVAICGSQLNKYQINLLTKRLGVSEIIIALDKENKNGWREKIINMCKKYQSEAYISYVYDENNFLQDKDSPIDKGQEIWEKLFKKRIEMKG